MTRQYRLGALAEECHMACDIGEDMGISIENGWLESACSDAADIARCGIAALDHLAALEQQAITDYLADVPLPEGWTEDQDSSWGDQCYRYLDAEGNERVAAFKSGTCIWMKPAHWPAIPRAVLVRAAVRCGRLREG